MTVFFNIIFIHIYYSNLSYLNKNVLSDILSYKHSYRSSSFETYFELISTRKKFCRSETKFSESVWWRYIFGYNLKELFKELKAGYLDLNCKPHSRRTSLIDDVIGKIMLE